MVNPDYRAMCAELVDALDNLLALVNGECPSLLDGDRGGSGFLDIEIDDALTTARALLAQPEPEGPSADPPGQPLAIEPRGWPGMWELALAKTTAILDDPSRALLIEVRNALELNRRTLLAHWPVAEGPPAAGISDGMYSEPLAQEAYFAFVQICKGGSDDADTYDADEAIVRRALKRLDELEEAYKELGLLATKAARFGHPTPTPEATND